MRAITLCAARMVAVALLLTGLLVAAIRYAGRALCAGVAVRKGQGDMPACKP